MSQDVIRVTKAQKRWLRKLKVHRNQPYHEILEALIRNWKYHGGKISEVRG